MQPVYDKWHRLLHGPAERRPPTDNKRRVRLLLSYAPDWIFTLILLCLIGILTDKAGYKRQFSLTDTSIQHTFAVNERISFGACIGYSAGVPVAIILLIGLGWQRSFWDLHNGWLGLFLSCSITTVVTQVIKVTVGRPRPDLIDRCQPVDGAANAPVYGLATVALCSVQSGHIIDDGFKSFPSGHSSFAFAGLGFLSLYLAGKMHLFDRRGFALKPWIAVAPVTGAALIAVSRTMDYRHHATDVIAGSLLGSVITFVVYRLYYPSIASPQAHLPFSPRVPRDLAPETLESTSEAGEGETLPRDSAQAYAHNSHFDAQQHRAYNGDSRLHKQGQAGASAGHYSTPAVPLQNNHGEWNGGPGGNPSAGQGYGRVMSRDSSELGRKPEQMV
ncbi:hypothetical protein OIV83_002927 [Microbotryomycetes sp. JL201]|nr:hypothetical protein OIV83_002927 [Microbotryomycetes sp. JL201]